MPLGENRSIIEAGQEIRVVVILWAQWIGEDIPVRDVSAIDDLCVLQYSSNAQRSSQYARYLPSSMDIIKLNRRTLEILRTGICRAIPPTLADFISWPLSVFFLMAAENDGSTGTSRARLYAGDTA